MSLHALRFVWGQMDCAENCDYIGGSRPAAVPPRVVTALAQRNSKHSVFREQAGVCREGIYERVEM